MKRRIDMATSDKPELEIIGAPWGNFVRTVCMAAREKGVPYKQTVVRPTDPEVAAIHPFSLVPCARHGDLVLFESRAICTYIDDAFDGPPLVPRDARGAAITEQWIALVLTTIDPVLARQYISAYLAAPDGKPDSATIEALLPKMHKCFAVLDERLAASRYLSGDAFNLSDMMLFPLMWFMRLKPESAAMLEESPHILDWYARVAERVSARETEPPVVTGPAVACGAFG
ncbi:glutathione S-transferase family protein [Rhodomicrobium vannielii ATCC 17100]|uniref:glutathione S-transferase family protein n=1 Tax=Rhodomicrobium vannielii TaxID=1069 RepID=UPI001917CC62|nr:glutathione S-transferase family protein [Rhodomicrobium vannielii]MBJ7534513.1 glutathione S-transferase family protein [Rhodomicrobium vannielii ATCC 17100]